MVTWDGHASWITRGMQLSISTPARTYDAGFMTHPDRQAMMDKAIAERRRIKAWLLSHMTGRKPKVFTKIEYRQMATVDLGSFSKAAFDHAWISAIEDSGRQDWYAPLPRCKEARQ